MPYEAKKQQKIKCMKANGNLHFDKLITVSPVVNKKVMPQSKKPHEKLLNSHHTF